MTEKEIIHDLKEIITFQKVNSKKFIVDQLIRLKDKIAKVHEVTCLDKQETCKFNKENLCKRINFCKFKSIN